MAECPVNSAAARRAYEDETAELRLAKTRARILKNYPPATAPLHWRRDSASRHVSSCGRFAIEKAGDGEAARYTAKLLPHTVLGLRCYTFDEAKERCNRHVSPLPLEASAPLIEREPGCDDE
jgi:hypothetical protein